MTNRSFVRLGVLTRTFGLAGGLRLALDGDIVPQLATPCDAWLGFSENFVRPHRLLRCQQHGETLICFFDGVVSGDEAKELIDQAMFVEPEVVSYSDPLANPRLIGYRVRNEAGEDLGELASVFTTPAHHIWTIRNDDHEWMMPAISQFLIAIDDEARAVTVRLIPGMYQEQGDEEAPL